MVVRALVFDVFGTLVDWRSGVAEAFRASEVPGDPEELADAWRARYGPILAEVNGGLRPWANLDELHLATLGALLSERGLDLPLAQRRVLVGAWHHLDPWPDVPSGLEALRRQRVTAALSNGHVALLVDLARHGNLRFDCLLSAELVRAYKPAPVVYETAAALLDMECGELMLVAAHPYDLEGARAAGLATALVERPLEYGTGAPPQPDPDADETVSDLHELAERLALATEPPAP
jgi:2-haloacid dehalogenase